MSEQRDERFEAEAEVVADGVLVDDELAGELPVLAEAAPLDRRRAQALPAVQAAAAATTGFLAGAATVALAQRLKGVQRARLAARRPPEALPVVSSRTFLVNVHVIGRE
jgi:hypothetical protein